MNYITGTAKTFQSLDYKGSSITVVNTQQLILYSGTDYALIILDTSLLQQMLYLLENEVSGTVGDLTIEYMWGDSFYFLGFMLSVPMRGGGGEVRAYIDLAYLSDVVDTLKGMLS